MELSIVDTLSERDLWDRLSQGNDKSVRNMLIGNYLPYAKMLAATMFSHRPDDAVDFADYEQLASLGLINAIDKFDCTIGVAFKTFASYRIKGSILNGLEKTTERRNLYAVYKRVNKDRVLSLADEITADSKGDTFAAFVQTTLGLAISCILDDVEGSNAESMLVGSDPYAHNEYLNLKKRLFEIVDLLPENEKKVVQYHYYHQIDFIDIAGVFELSKGRISQIHKSAIMNIKKLFDSKFNIDKSY